MEPRDKIVTEFSRWTAHSALRANGGYNSKKVTYTLLKTIEFDELFDSLHQAAPKDFSSWHKRQAEQIVERAGKQKIKGRDGFKTMTIGWAAKLINVYLKCRIYIANDVPGDLIKLIHPPIDSALWKGVEKWITAQKHADLKDALATINIKTLAGITTYADYEKIMDFFLKVAKKANCKLIEVEQFWDPEG